MTNCPICLIPLLQEPFREQKGSTYVCCNCGPYMLSPSLDVNSHQFGFTPHERAALSHGLARRGSTFLTSHLLEAIIKDTTLPDAHAVVDNLLLHISQEIAGPGELTELWTQGLRGTLGVRSAEAARWAIEQALASNLIAGIPAKSSNDAEYRVLRASLTVMGWQRVHEAQRSARDSRKAFMAMKFGDVELDGLFRQQLKPAVALTGFNLTRLDEEPRAGSIDDRLRLEIRTSRFLVADLTHANNGAYWEAGFAEGLGRPVIYTCRSDIFDNEETRPHFDTNHHLTVIWDPADLKGFVEQLKTVIRVTLPLDAQLADGVS